MVVPGHGPNAIWFVCRHLAASEGSYKVTEWLLSEQADINSLDRFKRTPLEVRLLLEGNIASCVGP